jgi:hypothetical protein
MLNDDFIESLRVRLEAHSVYAGVQTLDDCACSCGTTSIQFWDGVLAALPSQ